MTYCPVTADLNRYLDRLAEEDAYASHLEESYLQGFADGITRSWSNPPMDSDGYDEWPGEAAAEYEQGYARGRWWRRLVVARARLRRGQGHLLLGPSWLVNYEGKTGRLIGHWHAPHGPVLPPSRRDNGLPF